MLRTAEKAKTTACLFLPGSFVAYSLSVHLGRQGEFKCKAAEKSTERKNALKPLQTSGIIDGRNLKRKCMWDLTTSCLILGIVIFNCQHLSMTGTGNNQAASAYQERKILEAQH